MFKNNFIPNFVDANLSNLRNTRVHKFKLSLDIFSAMTGIPKGWIIRYEAGRSIPGKERYNKLAKFCGWKLWEA